MIQDRIRQLAGDLSLEAMGDLLVELRDGKEVRFDVETKVLVDGDTPVPASPSDIVSVRFAVPGVVPSKGEEHVGSTIKTQQLGEMPGEDGLKPVQPKKGK